MIKKALERLMPGKIKMVCNNKNRLKTCFKAVFVVAYHFYFAGH